MRTVATVGEDSRRRRVKTLPEHIAFLALAMTVLAQLSDLRGQSASPSEAHIAWCPEWKLVPADSRIPKADLFALGGKCGIWINQAGVRIPSGFHPACRPSSADRFVTTNTGLVSVENRFPLESRRNAKELVLGRDAVGRLACVEVEIDSRSTLRSKLRWIATADSLPVVEVAVVSSALYVLRERGGRCERWLDLNFDGRYETLDDWLGVVVYDKRPGFGLSPGVRSALQALKLLGVPVRSAGPKDGHRVEWAAPILQVSSDSTVAEAQPNARRAEESYRKLNDLKSLVARSLAKTTGFKFQLREIQSFDWKRHRLRIAHFDGYDDLEIRPSSSLSPDRARPFSHAEDLAWLAEPGPRSEFSAYRVSLPLHLHGRTSFQVVLIDEFGRAVGPLHSGSLVKRRMVRSG